MRNDFNRLLIGVIIILGSLLIDKSFKNSVFGFSSLKKEILRHGNYLKVAQVYGGLPLMDDMMVSGEYIDFSKYKDKKRIISVQEGVIAVSGGIVVKRDQNEAIIMDYNGNEYCYSNLKSIKVKIYERVTTGYLIGLCNYEDDYYYDFQIKENKR